MMKNLTSLYSLWYCSLRKESRCFNQQEKYMIYFRDKAKSLGCLNVDDLGDLAVWDFIISNQGGI